MNFFLTALFSVSILAACTGVANKGGRVPSSAPEGDGPQFLKSFTPKSMVCSGSKVHGGELLKEIGRVKVDILDQESETPFVEVTSEDKSLHFFIGNSFSGSQEKGDSCRYYSTEDKVYYVCGLVDASKPISFLDVRDAASRSSFSKDLVCYQSPRCIRLKDCSAAKN